MRKRSEIAELEASITAANHCMMVASTIIEFEKYASRRAALSLKLESSKAWSNISPKQRQKIPTTHHTIDNNNNN